MKQGDGPQVPVLMAGQGHWIKAAFLREPQSLQQQNSFFFSQLLEQSDPGRTCSLARDESSCLKKPQTIKGPTNVILHTEFSDN